jgi:uncharacterized protein (DUF2147 family)
MKTTSLIKLGVSIVSLLAIQFASAQATPVGLWKTIDDETGKPKSLVRITEQNGVYQGKVEKLFREPDQDQNPKCDKCEGVNKDQPILGMTILFNIKKEGDEYSGGQILDPAKGKLYKSKMSLIENNKKLNVRGFIGFSLLGRTQTWIREE